MRDGMIVEWCILSVSLSADESADERTSQSPVLDSSAREGLHLRRRRKEKVEQHARANPAARSLAVYVSPRNGIAK